MKKGESWTVWRMRKHGGWKKVKTFGKRESAKKLARGMQKEFITVKWRKD